MRSVTKGIAAEDTIFVPLELPKKHWKNSKAFGSCPVRRTALLSTFYFLLSTHLVFPGFFAFLANCFGFPAYPCMSMPAGAAPGEIIVLCAGLDPKNISVSRLESRQSRPRTLDFHGKACCFIVEGVGFELVSFVLWRASGFPHPRKR
jgi:hypothetical protein